MYVHETSLSRHLGHGGATATTAMATTARVTPPVLRLVAQHISPRSCILSACCTLPRPVTQSVIQITNHGKQLHFDRIYVQRRAQTYRIGPTPTSPVAMEFRKKIRAYDSATTTRAPAAPKAIGACCVQGKGQELKHICYHKMEKLESAIVPGTEKRDQRPAMRPKLFQGGPQLHSSEGPLKAVRSACRHNK